MNVKGSLMQEKHDCIQNALCMYIHVILRSKMKCMIWYWTRKAKTVVLKKYLLSKTEMKAYSWNIISTCFWWHKIRTQEVVVPLTPTYTYDTAGHVSTRVELINS